MLMLIWKLKALHRKNYLQEGGLKLIAQSFWELQALHSGMKAVVAVLHTSPWLQLATVALFDGYWDRGYSSLSPDKVRHE